MKGLIIKPKWADLILNGYKDIEIRGSNTTVRGKIGIIKSGTKKVYGTVELYDCKEIGKWEFENIFIPRHQLDMTYEELLKIYPKPYGWFLKSPKIYDEPKNYEHKLGSVVWVNLDEGE